MKHPRYLSTRTFIVIGALLILIAGGLSAAHAADAPDPTQAVQDAWARAAQSGVYHFRTEIVQTTYPAPMLANVGRSSRTDNVYIEGQTDARTRQFLMTLWDGGGNALNGQDAIEIRMDGEKTYGRAGGDEWQEIPDFAGAFAPGSDLMAYLAGVKDVVEVGSSVSLPDSPYAVVATQYAFTLDGPSLARHVRDQLERELARKGELPIGITLDVSTMYHSATGRGDVWIGADGLPLRLALHILYPRQTNGEQVEAQVQTDFSNFALAQAPGPAKALASALGLPQTRHDWQNAAMQTGFALLLAGMLLVLVTHSRSKLVYRAVALTMVLSMLFTPLLTDVQAAAFMDEQAVKQATLDQQQAEQAQVAEAQAEMADPQWNPNQDPLESQEADFQPVSTGFGYQPANSFAGLTGDEDDPYSGCTDAEKAADADKDLLTDCQERLMGTDPAKQDSDSDGLWDSWEVLRLGTSPLAADSDGDDLSDSLEVVGYTYQNKRWYSNPNTADTDKDTLADNLECPERRTVNSVTPSVDAACRDTDSDGTPNLFDLDSDNDGVPDQSDLSPLSVIGQATPFTRDNPFQWQASNFSLKTGSTSAYYPVLVDYQLRPVNPKHLTYVMNVLDWPSGDEQGQIQRRTGNDTTFADAMTPDQRATDPRAQNGDVRLIPMLEIEMSGSNLPLPFKTDLRASVPIQGVDTSWPVSTTPPVFTSWLTATLDLAQGGTAAAPQVATTLRWTGSSSLDMVSLYQGQCAEPSARLSEQSLVGRSTPFTWAIGGVRVTDVADGNHFVLVEKAGHDPVCVPIPALPTGPYNDRMIDPAPLAAYNIIARDKDKAGTVLMYAPGDIVPDASGGGRVAFSARIPYFPNNGTLGSAAQKVRLVWFVQVLADLCTPAPLSASDADAEVWCDYTESWNLNTAQVIHTYGDDWYLTGLTVREDHGFAMAIAWEDPSVKTAEQRQQDNWLWPMALGLEEVFLSGRDANDNDRRDLGVALTADGATVADATISSRFDAPLAASVTITDRWGIPLTATLQVEAVSYTTQDHVGMVMMTDTTRILNTNFAAYTDAVPSLLFAREERYRTANLDVAETRTLNGSNVSFNLTGQKVNTLTALNWAPYRYRDGAWRAFPLAEYWDLLGARLKAALPLDPELDAERGENVRAGQIVFARSYYLAMNQGRVALVGLGDDLSHPYNPLQGDGSLTMSLSLLMTRSGISMVGGVATVVGMVVDTMVDIYESEVIFSRYAGKLSNIALGDRSDTAFLELVGKGLKTTAAQKVSDLLETLTSKLNSKFKAGMAIVGAIAGAVAIVATMVVGFAFAKAELMLTVCISAVTATVQIVLAIKTIYEVATKTLAAVSKAAMICTIVGFIIGVGVAFAGLVTTLVAGKLKLTSTAAHAAMAEAIAYVVVATIMLIISLIPVVGQIIAAILGAIDALILALCGVISAAVGRDVRKGAAGQWLCKGLSGLTAELIKWAIYSSRTLADLQDPDRLQFGRFDYDLSDPDKGLVVGNDLYLTLDLTSTLELVSLLPASEAVIAGWKDGTALVPADWKSMSYWWQFSDSNVKKSTFRYVIQAEETDIDGDLDLEQMSDEWQATGQAHVFVVQPTPVSDPIPLDKAGINQPVQALVTEGTDVAVQECWTVPSPMMIGTGGTCVIPYICLVPVCVIRGEKNSNHIPLGDRFVLDVLPATLDEFYTALADDGGYTLAWGQDASLTFGRQPDFDGDTLLGRADGGADPDDSRWDTDADSLSDAWELAHGTDPQLLDSDNDGLSDAEEIALKTDPLRKDSDGDGLTDKEELTGWEMVYGINASGSALTTWVTSDPLMSDADDDGLNDFKEKTFGYNPNLPSDPNVFSIAGGVFEFTAPRLLLRFDETPGAQTFMDRGSLNGAVCASDACPDAGQDGRYAYAAQFGSGDALSLPNGPTNRVSREFTVAAWVRPAQVSAAQNIVATAQTASVNGFAFGLSANSVSLTLRGVGSYNSAGGVTANQWTHVAAVLWNGKVSFYVNGVFQRQVSVSRPVTPDPDDDLIVGATSATDSFIGMLDDVAFYDRALNATDVQAVMQGRFNINDTLVVPAQTLAYTATLANRLMGRYAQGLLSIAATPPLALTTLPAPQAFVLQPATALDMAGYLTVGALSTQPISVTETAQALITDWREQSNYARLWLPLDEAKTQTVFQDHSGTLPAANGVCSGSTCPARQESGYYDYALGFNGNQSVTLSDTVRLGFQNSSFAVSVWANTQDLRSNRYILSTVGGTGNPKLNVLLRDGKPTLGFDNNLLSSPDALQANRWYHLVFRYDKDKTEQTLYVNGDLKASRTGVAAFSGTGAVMLGSAWRGWLDDVRVYDRALTLSEIRELYNRPVMRLQFEETTRPTAPQPTVYFADVSGLGNGGSCTGKVCPAPAVGVTGQRAREFDGADYVSIPSRPGLALNDGQFTLAAWVWPDAQGEPVTPTCAFQTQSYTNTKFTGTPAQTGCTNWLDASMDAGEGSQNAAWLVNYAPSPSTPISTRWTGQFNFASGDYVFNFATGGSLKFYVDGVEVVSYSEVPGIASASADFTIQQSGVHEIKVEVAEQQAPYGAAFGWMPPHVQGILGKDSGRADAYPSLLNVGGRLRFGFGAGPLGWVSRTTTETVLLPNTWNHVVLAFGPRTKTDGSFDQNVATLYINNQKKAEWGVGAAAPVATTTSFDVGRASNRGAIYLDYFKLTTEADESKHAEIYIQWDGSKICSAADDPGDDCIWGDLNTDNERKIQRTRTFVEDAELRAYESDDGFESGHNYGDDPLCDSSETQCTHGYTFDSDDISIPKKTFRWEGDNLKPSHGLNNEDTSAIALHLGDATHWAYRNPSIPFRGRLDEIILYKRALSTEDVQELYLSASMALHLKVDEAPGSASFENAVDLSKQSNAFCSGSACPTAGVAGRINQAVLFDGASDWLSTTLTLDPASGATLMAWVRPAAGGNVSQTVLSTDNGAGGWGIVRDGTTWKVLNRQTLVDTGATVTSGAWQHVAATFGAGGLKFYLNGQAVFTTTLNAPRGKILAIGRRPAGGAYWAGEIDDVRVFNTVLSPASIQTLYRAAPIVHLHLDEATGATQFANIVGAFSGTCTTCPKAGVDGQVGQAVEFNLIPNHTADQIVIAADAALNLSRFSVGAWVQPSAIKSNDQVLVSKGNNYKLSIPANGLQVRLTFAPVSGGGCGAAQSVTSLAALLPNQWNYVMGTYDGNAARLYVNGYEQGSLVVSGGACASTAGVSIGGTSSSDAFAGRLDEASLYTYALNPFEARDIFRYQAKLVQERRTDVLFVDNTPPTSELRSYNPSQRYLANQNVLMYVAASDAHAGVSQVELLVMKLGQSETWTPAPACMDADGDAAWCPFFKPSGEGQYSFVTRATDWAGNRENSRPALILYVDGAPPVATLAQTAEQVVSALPHPTLQNTWLVQLNGTVNDPILANSGNAAGSGVQADSVRVSLVDATGAILGGAAQAVALSGVNWSLDYLIPEAQPTGRYTVHLEAADRIGNQADIALATILVDASAPGGDVSGALALPVTAITSTRTLQGVVSEAPAPRDTALLLHLEEDTGATRFYDNSGAARHADCTGAACPTAAQTGQYGRAASFDGNDALQIAHSALNEWTAGFSIAAWVNPATVSGVQRFVATARTRSVNGFGLGLSGNKLLFTTYGVKDYTLGALSTGQWTHVAVVVGDDHAVSFYQNGVLIGVVAATGPANAALDDALFIGAGTVTGSATPTDFYTGLLDEVIIVDRALLPEEVSALAQSKSAGVSGLQVAWRPTLPGSPFFNEAPLPGETLHLALEDMPAQSGALTWQDISGQAHHGACTGAACPAYGVTGHAGSAAAFDGKQTTIALPSWGTFTNATVSAWVKRTSETGARETIISYKEAGSCGFVLSLNEDKVNHYPRIWMKVSGSWKYAEQAVTIPLNAWVHLSATYDGATLRLYRDGQLVASTAAAGALAQCSAVSAIGSKSDGKYHFFPGVIDDVRMFDRALSADALRKQLYLGGNPTLHLPMDEAWAVDGSRLPDASGWQHDGALHTGANANNKATSGAVGGFGLTLDGVDDYVALEPDAGLRPGADFSLAAWVYPSPADTGAYPILSSDAYTGPVYASPYLQVVNRTGLQTSFGDGVQAPPLSVSGVLAENTWNHVAATFDGTTYRLYVNGVERLTSTAFAGRRPAGSPQLDIGRGAPATAACVTFSKLTLTPRSMGKYTVALNGTQIYQTSAAATPNVAIAINPANVICEPATLQVSYIAPTPGVTWQQSLTLNPQPGQGSQTLKHPTLSYSTDLAWTLAAQPASLRYWRGKLDDVRVYPRALLPLEVATLAKTGWQAATLTQSGNGINLAGWSTSVPAGLEGSFALDLRGVDAAGHVGASGLAAQVWNGQVDTLAPRLAITRTTVGGQYRYITVAEDFNLLPAGFSSPCGAGVVATTGYYRSPWYQGLVGQSSLGSKIIRLTADCTASPYGLSERGAWTERPSVSGKFAIVGNEAFVPSGALWRVSLANPSLPNDTASYNAAGDGRSVVVSGYYAYIADGSRGLSIVNRYNPSGPAARLDTPGTATDVAVQGNYAYVADGTGGIRVINVLNPANPQLAGTYATPGSAQAIALVAPVLLSGVKVDPAPALEAARPALPQRRTLAAPMVQAGDVLSPTAAEAGEQFGAAVAAYRDYLVVGAPYKDGDGTDQGGVYLWRYNTVSGNWTLSTTLVFTWGIGSGGNHFGSAVAFGDLSGNPVPDILVGAPDEQTASDGSGAGYQLRSGQPANPDYGQWVISQTVAGSTMYEHAGYAVEQLGPDTFIVGIPGEPAYTGGAVNIGYTYLSDLSGRFGAALALSGNTLVVGAPDWNSETFTATGAAKIYTYTYDALTPPYYTWTALPLTLTSPTPAESARFGASVDIDGDTLVIGGAAGEAYVFLRNQGGDNVWGQVATLTPTGVVSGGFGSAVALTGDRIAVGAPLSDVGGNAEQGAVYVFMRDYDPANPDVPAPENWGLSNVLTRTDGGAGDHFGAALALSGDMLVVGAPDAAAAGRAYVYYLDLAAADDSYTTVEDRALDVSAPGVLGNDTVGGHAAVTVTLMTSPTHGALLLRNDGSFVYTPTGDYDGQDIFRYRVSSDLSTSNVATVTLTIQPENDAPTLDAISDRSVDEDVGVQAVTLTGIGSGASNEAQTLVVTAQSSTPALIPTPTIVYTSPQTSGALSFAPAADRWGAATLTVTVSDGVSTTLRAFQVTVNPLNDAPTAADIVAITDEEVPVQIAPYPLYAGDIDGDALTVVNLGMPAHGTVTTNGVTVTYTPTLNFIGDDAFAYTMRDPGGLQATARITVTVGGVNDPPVAVDDAFTTNEDTPLTLTVLGNDSDPDGQTPFLSAVGTPSLGQVTLAGAALRYTPTLNLHGTDTFTYTISDGALSDTATVVVTVNAVNDAPTLDALSNLTLNEDAGQQTVALTGIGTGASNETQTLVVTAQSSNLTLIPAPTVTNVSPQASGTLRFTPAANLSGAATITVTVSDGLLTTVRAFQVTVNAVNDAPTLNTPANLEMGLNAGTQTVRLSGIGTGAPNEVQPLVVTAQSSNPALIPNPTVTYVSPNTTGQLSLTPAAGQTGVAAITVTVSDGVSQTARAFQVTVWSLTGPLGYVALGANDLLIVDLGTPATPRRLNTVALPGETQDIVVSGARAYVAAGSAGLLILDITPRANPQVLGRYDTPGTASGVAVSGTFVYVADGYAGVQMLDISNPAAPTLHTTHNTPGYANKVGVTGQYVIVADGGGGLRVLDTLAPLGQATACDTSGNCTTVAATVTAAPLQVTQADLGVSIVDAPPVLTALEPLTITGEALAEVSSLHALTVTVDGSSIYTTSWAQDEVTQTMWSAVWDPSALTDGPHALEAAVSDWAGSIATETQAVIVDTVAPGLSLTPLLTSTNFHALGLLDLTGLVTDAGGIKRLEVTVVSETLLATFEEGVWRAPWTLSGGALPDGDVFTVAARAVDVGEHTTLVTESVTVDIVPPASVALTMTSAGAIITPGLTLRGLTPTLELAWTESSDGSGLATYRVEWMAAVTTTQRVISQTHYPERTAVFTPAEGEGVWARVAAEDVYGQQSWQSIGPFYVDAPLTPDYTVLEPGAATYRGWMESGCALVGVDRRLSRKAAPGAALSAEQALYASWDVEALRLAWTGADWNVDGDLFVYLDVREGGATALFDPYGQGEGQGDPAPTRIYLPGVTPTSTVGAMGADFLVWVRDDETALLLTWMGEYWDWVLTLDSSQYRFTAGGGQGDPAPTTDLWVPFVLLGVADPANTALAMVALASEEDALRLWATLPAANPVNSARVADIRDESASGEFALSQAYHWDGLTDGVCPNGSDGSADAYPDTDVQVTLAVEPDGVMYSFMHDDLTGLWATLLQGGTPDVSSQLGWLNGEHPRVGANQMVTYTLTYRNLGTDTARGVWVDVQAFYTLRLSDGGAHQTLLLGDIAPGQEGQATFTAAIDLAASSLPWAGVLAQVYDEQHDISDAPLDRLWADHQVDRSGPQFLGIQRPAAILTAGNNTLRGYVYDESPVPSVTLDVQGRGSVTCADAAPSDGAWACDLDATGLTDGTFLNVTLRATDLFGQSGTTGSPQTFVVDALPPTVALDAALSQAALDSVVKGNSVRVNGTVTDAHGLGRVEACVDGVCTPLALQLAVTTGKYMYDDAPADPISLTAACLVRTFVVTDSFTLGAVKVGFVAAHEHRDDLHVTLASPAGTVIQLLTDDGVSGTDARHYNVLLDEASGSPYSSGGDDDLTGGVFVRAARPVEPLRVLVGQPAQGTWTLTVCDTHPAADDGDYRQSRLILTPQAAQNVPQTGSWAYTLSGDARVDAVERAVALYGVDLAGNRAAAVTARYVLDNVAPVITTTDIVNTALYTASLTVLSGTVTDGGAVASVSVLVESGETVYREPAVLEGTTWAYTLRPMTPGHYTLWVSAYDAAGNMASSGPFEVEVQAPILKLIYLPFMTYETTVE